MRLEDSDVQMDLDPSSPKYLGLDSAQGKPDGQEENRAHYRGEPFLEEEWIV